MIKIVDRAGTAHYIAPDYVAKVEDAPVFLHYHGIFSTVTTADGETFQAGVPAADIALAVENALAARICK